MHTAGITSQPSPHAADDFMERRVHLPPSGGGPNVGCAPTLDFLFRTGSLPTGRGWPTFMELPHTPPMTTAPHLLLRNFNAPLPYILTATAPRRRIPPSDPEPPELHCHLQASTPLRILFFADFFSFLPRIGIRRSRIRVSGTLSLTLDPSSPTSSQPTPSASRRDLRRPPGPHRHRRLPLFSTSYAQHGSDPALRTPPTLIHATCDSPTLHLISDASATPLPTSPLDSDVPFHFHRLRAS
jgi:hypothetical protein